LELRECNLLHAGFIKNLYAQYMKILLVEDNQKLAESVKKGLEQESYIVDCLFDGGIAERRIFAYPQDYDLVILDIMLPGKNGLEVCQAWREKNITIPILMLTAKDTTSDKVLGLDAGGDDYLIKPFAFEELLARIRALLRRPKESTPNVLSAQGITLNNGSKKVMIAGKEVPLTLREFSILEYFLRNPNQVLTREQILAHVWEFSFDSLSNVVDVHIKNLRRKLGSNYGQHLQTLRGLGYRFTV
jgi:DNA-binding response OmpR family regulator